MKAEKEMVSMRSKTCCFTGHRTIPTSQYQSVAERLEQTIVSLIRQGVIYYGSGGALGFDTMAAQTVIQLKRIYPSIKLILVLPCISQAERWSGEAQRIYEGIKTHADKIVYVSQEYTKECMFKRNRHLVDNSSICVCYLTQNTGGTAYTVNYAREKKVPVIDLAK